MKGEIMKVLRWLLMAFSMYSKIPVPGFKGKDEDMKGCLAFLPLIGAVIAALMFAAIRLLSDVTAPLSAKALFAVVIPLIVTGGFHVDGFMDTADALSSYQPKERRLEILKDPHIGSFAVIHLLTAGLIFTASILSILNTEAVNEDPLFIFVCSVFIISRALAALTSVLAKKAKDDGLLVSETSGAETFVTVFSFIWLIAALSFIAFLDIKKMIVIFAAFAATTVFYILFTKKNFGGVTGDTAGYFITLSETVAVLFLAIYAFLPAGIW